MTANIAIDLRAKVTLKPFKSGSVFLDLDGLGKQEFAVPALPLTGPFALVSALICYFGVHGFHLQITTDFPFQSGLGGSGAVSIALIGAIYTAMNDHVPQSRDFPSLVKIAHHLEDSLFRNTGMQDQAAALYGGANLWEWHYSDKLDFNRLPIASDISTLNDHLLLAYTGRPHEQSQNGSRMLSKFKENGALGVLVSISRHARDFAESVSQGEFRSAGASLEAEYHLRSRLLPVLDRGDLELVEMATDAECGVSITGNGGGGCIWAIGEKEDIAQLRQLWEDAFERRRSGFLLPANASCSGLTVTAIPADEYD